MTDKETMTVHDHFVAAALSGILASFPPVTRMDIIRSHFQQEERITMGNDRLSLMEEAIRLSFIAADMVMERRK